jgi:hypothetical protein
LSHRHLASGATAGIIGLGLLENASREVVCVWREAEVGAVPAVFR